MLDSPASEDEIYLARAGDVNPYRPVCQGDVFADVLIPGRDLPGLAMVISHPCAMRAGPRMRERVTLVPVNEHRAIALEEWAGGHLRVMPLPALREDGQAYAANLEEPASVDSALLAFEQRIASLSDQGILLLQQRYIHNHSRAAIPLELLYEASAHVLEELELHESWNIALARPAVEGGSELGEVLEEQAEEFDQLMLTKAADDRDLRELLKSVSERAHVRRIVNQAIAERRG